MSIFEQVARSLVQQGQKDEQKWRDDQAHFICSPKEMTAGADSVLEYAVSHWDSVK